MNKTILALTLVAFLSGCGGSDDNDKNNSSPPPSDVVKTGVLTDKISGVRYITSSGREETTNEKGEFKFNTGETVKFFVGGVQLGEEISAKEIVSLLDLSDNPQIRENLMVFLQSLDSEGEYEDGIQISTATIQALQSKTLNFDQSANSFVIDPTVTAVISAEKLVTLDEAKANIQKTFYKNVAGSWELNRTVDSAVLIHIFEDGRYVLGEAGEAENSSQSGIEIGDFRWDATNASLFPSISVDTNGEWGLSYEEEPYSLNYDGTNLILSESVDGVKEEHRFTRVKQSSGLVGTWMYGTTHLFAFYDDSHYFLIDTLGDEECGTPGIEYGKYTLLGNNFTTTDVAYDTNGCGGLQDGIYKAKGTINISDSNLTLQSQGEDSITLQRVN